MNTNAGAEINSISKNRAITMEWLLIPLCIFMVAWNSGIWPMPNLGAQYAVSQSLLKNPFPDPMAQYIMTNYLEPFLFGCFGGKGVGAYFIFCLLVSVAFVATFCIWFLIYHGKDVALNGGAILTALTFPVFFIPFYWVGMDGMTLLLMLATLILFNRRLVLIPAILLGFQHFEQALAGFLVLLGAQCIEYAFRRDQKNFRAIAQTVLILIGVALGKILLQAWFRLFGIDLTGGRMNYLGADAGHFFQNWRLHWSVILWALCGTSWLYVVLALKRVWPILPAALITFLFMGVVGDQTRVGVIILFPSIFYWIFRNKELQIKTSGWKNYLFVIIYTIVPITVVWGAPHHDLRLYDWKTFQELRANTFDLSQFNWLEPFVGSVAGKNGSEDATLSFLGAALPTKIGLVEGSSLVTKPKSGDGFLSFGPYVDLAAGEYRATIKYASDERASTVVGWVDVTEKAGSVELIKRVVRGTDGVNSYIEMEFSLASPSKGVEVRVWSDGNSRVFLRALDITRLHGK